jgi:hypothetical protein
MTTQEHQVTSGKRKEDRCHFITLREIMDFAATVKNKR